MFFFFHFQCKYFLMYMKLKLKPRQAVIVKPINHTYENNLLLIHLLKVVTVVLVALLFMYFVI